VQKFGGRLLSLLELGALPASLERLWLMHQMIDQQELIVLPT
jgi:hypothetical protein